MVSTISLRSVYFFFSTAFLRSYMLICRTFSTRKRSRFDSSLMTLPRCSIIFGLFARLLSFIIWAAREMLAIGVFSSCVMLLIKSFFISLYRFCRKMMTIVKMNVTSSTKVKMMDGIMKRTLEKM